MSPASDVSTGCDAMKRKIAAIMAADAPGYAGLLAHDRVSTLSELQTARRLFSTCIEAHDGRIFNTSGASVLAEFSSAVEAVRCALSVQTQLNGSRADSGNAAPRLGFRIGLTIGDIVEHEGDLLGDGVNIAARLATLVGEGGVCVSRPVYDQVRNKIEATVVDLGHRTLKNLPEPVHALELRAGGTGKMPAFAAPTYATARGFMIAGVAAIAAVLALIASQPRAPSDARGRVDNTGIAAPNTQPAAEQQSVRVPNTASSASEFGKTKNSSRCSEILERVQSGFATASDRAALVQDCQ